MKGQFRATCILALLALLAASPILASGEVITQGADLWKTATGFTFTSFANNPIPADFFCPGSKPFTSLINLRGEPLATQPAGSLGGIDTIIRRLDDARLNDQGEASTRIQVMALSLASVQPVDTGCGLYDVKATLAGEQPTTEMKIVRTSDRGGYYIAPLELNVKLVFTPVAGGPSRELMNHVSLGPGSQSIWSYDKPVAQAKIIRVDTDGDGVVETVLPGPSNFRTGMAPAAGSQTKLCEYESCHCANGSTNPYEPNSCCDHFHCVTVWVDCNYPVQPIRPNPTPCPAITP
jgi:hypothetical protein